MPVQFPHQPGVAHGLGVTGVEHTPRDERCTLAPHGIEMPVDRIAKPERAVAEKIEVAPGEGVGGCQEFRPVILEARRHERRDVSLGRPREEPLRRDLADDPERGVGIREVRGVLPQQRLGMFGELDRRDPFKPLRGLLPAAIGELREPHVADPAQAAAVAALCLGAKRRQRRLEWKG